MSSSSSSTAAASTPIEPAKQGLYLAQSAAVALDTELMGPYGFRDADGVQLMELAALSCACAIHEVFPPASHKRVLIVCGPGNNGADGLVATRHLVHFGYAPSLLYPKRTDKPLYKNLLQQVVSLEVPVLDALPDAAALKRNFDVVVDAIFGFSFQHGSIRAPFDAIIATLKQAGVPVASVDVPSGWHIDRGNIDGSGVEPHLLISLTAPKLCALEFKGPVHYLGGRFVPPALLRKFGLTQLPVYPGSAQCVRLK